MAFIAKGRKLQGILVFNHISWNPKRHNIIRNPQMFGTTLASFGTALYTQKKRPAAGRAFVN
jgi:hypothetical protein